MSSPAEGTVPYLAAVQLADCAIRLHTEHQKVEREWQAKESGLQTTIKQLQKELDRLRTEIAVCGGASHVPLAAHRVFAVPELLEQILQHLPHELTPKEESLERRHYLEPDRPLVQLFPLQRVSRQFAALITSSPALQERMGLRDILIDMPRDAVADHDCFRILYGPNAVPNVGDSSGNDDLPGGDLPGHKLPGGGDYSNGDISSWDIEILKGPAVAWGSCDDPWSHAENSGSRLAAAAMACLKRLDATLQRDTDCDSDRTWPSWDFSFAASWAPIRVNLTGCVRYPLGEEFEVCVEDGIVSRRCYDYVCRRNTTWGELVRCMIWARKDFFEFKVGLHTLAKVSPDVFA